MKLGKDAKLDEFFSETPSPLDHKINIKTLTQAIIDEQGREINNPVPFQPIGIRPKEEGLQGMIQRLIRRNISEIADSQGFETFEESQDFDVQDPFDLEPSGAAEMDEDFPEIEYPDETPSEASESTIEKDIDDPMEKGPVEASDVDQE